MELREHPDELRARAEQAPWMRFEVLLAAFLTVYVAVALAAQALSSVPPNFEVAPIEAFTSGLLWILAMYGLVRTTEVIESGKRLFFWLALTAALGALAVDEIVGVHEATEPGLNDDWVKVVMWVGTPFILRYIANIENAPKGSRVAMAIGYAFHTAYILVEIGDGDAFTLPVSIEVLKWSEEVFELLFLSAYAYALWMLVLRQHVRRNPAAGFRTDGDDS